MISYKDVRPRAKKFPRLYYEFAHTLLYSLYRGVLGIVCAIPYRPVLLFLFRIISLVVISLEMTKTFVLARRVWILVELLVLNIARFFPCHYNHHHC